MTVIEAFNLISAVVSTVLAVVALYLAIVFYRLSMTEAQRSQKSAEEISASVKRIEALFSSMYADTFTMMRETVTDMRAHVWRSPGGTSDMEDTVRAAEEQAARVQTELVESIAEVSKRLGLAEGSLNSLRDQVAPIIHDALETNNERRIRLTKDVIVKSLQGKVVKAERLRSIAAKETGGDTDEFLRVIRELSSEGVIEVLGDNSRISPQVEVILKPPPFD